MSNSKKSTKGKASGQNSQKQPQKARIQNNKNRLQPVRSAPVRSDRAAISNNRTSCNRTGRRSELVISLKSYNNEFHVIKRLRCNPLSEDTFTWLPSIAKNFESYKFHYLAFRFENRCSTTTAGSKIMSPSYDAADSNAQAQTEELLYANKGTIDASVWRNDTLVLSGPSMNRLYKSHTCMSDGRFSNSKEDQKTIDVAQVFVALDGVEIGNNVGKLFVDYDVEFYEPHSPTEPPYSGGAVVDFSGFPTVPIHSASTLPFPVGMTVGNRTIVNEPNVPILTDYTPDGSTNTSAVSQFLRDWSGMVTVTSSVPSFASFGVDAGGQQLYTSPSPNTPAGSPGDTLAGVLDNINYTSMDLKNVVTAYKVIAKAGDYLKWFSPNTTMPNVIQRLLLQYGASSVF